VQPEDAMPGPGTVGPVGPRPEDRGPPPPWPPPATWDQGQSWPSYWVPPGVAPQQAWAPPPGPPAYQPVAWGPYGPMPVAPPNEPMASGP